jgi:hypothetical protein
MTGKEPATAERKAPAGVRLPTPAQAKQWEELGPGTFARLMSEVEQEEKHRRRMEWAELCSRVFGQVWGLLHYLMVGRLDRSVPCIRPRGRAQRRLPTVDASGRHPRRVRSGHGADFG